MCSAHPHICEFPLHFESFGVSRPQLKIHGNSHTCVYMRKTRVYMSECVCAYVCMCVYLCVCVYVCKSDWMSEWVSEWVPSCVSQKVMKWVRACVLACNCCVCEFVYVSVRSFCCACVCVFVCVCVCLCVCDSMCVCVFCVCLCEFVFAFLCFCVVVVCVCVCNFLCTFVFRIDWHMDTAVHYVLLRRCWCFWISFHIASQCSAIVKAGCFHDGIYGLLICL